MKKSRRKWVNVDLNSLTEFFKLESFGGILLFSVALLALVLENSDLRPFYEYFVNTKIAIHVGPLYLRKTVTYWVNDGLMALYFLLVGLEIKREIFKGVLQSVAKIILPGVGALGGLVTPALIYFFFNHHDSVGLQGWAIPAATDIAFSLGILALLGKRIPIALKIFLTALAILDDIAAILIIALFYTNAISMLFIWIAILLTTLLFVMNKGGIKNLTPYCIIGVGLWFAVLNAGIHATLAGIILAFVIPLEPKVEKSEGIEYPVGKSPLLVLEHALHPWATYVVLPLFAFVNAGFSIADLSWEHLFHPIPLGIIIGLFVGKQVGIISFSWILVKLKLAELPEGMDWGYFYGLALTCGVGFTMSLFISHLAFQNQALIYQQMARLGIIIGSLISGILGYAFLRVYSEFRKA